MSFEIGDIVEVVYSTVSFNGNWNGLRIKIASLTPGISGKVVRVATNVPTYIVGDNIRWGDPKVLKLISKQVEQKKYLSPFTGQWV